MSRGLNYLVQSLSNLGFRIHWEKSSLTPSQELTFLGYILNSVQLTVTPNGEKITKLLAKIECLLQETRATIRSAASVLGLMSDMCKGIAYGLAYVKFLEIDKIKSLRWAGKAQFEGRFVLSSRGREELKWWSTNAKIRSRDIRGTGPSLFLTTDASKSGWGAVFGAKRQGVIGHPKKLACILMS